MPLNFNIRPYYDDFDETKDYCRILFRPGVALQSREFTQLQTILQRQISRFGQHVFEEGSVVIPGDISYDLNYTYVKVEPNANNVLESWWDNPATTVTGKTLIGETSSVRAVVVNHLAPDADGKVAIYVKYSYGDGSAGDQTFVAGEMLAVDGVPGLSFTVSAAPFTPLGVGSAASIKEGIYFIYGMLLRVAQQTIILSPYSNAPSCRIGLRVVVLVSLS